MLGQILGISSSRYNKELEYQEFEDAGDEEDVD